MLNTYDPVLLKGASEAQAQALEVGKSVWISANAGTGKTEVLTRRMLALLVSDFSLEPRQILALTFTKAGAAEMAARLPARLANWAALGDEALVARVNEETGCRDGGVAGSQKLVERVRELAQAVRRAPPMVATIHGLAQQILGRFAVEAGLAPDFEVLEEGPQKRLLKDVQQNLLVHVDGALAECLGILLDELGEHGWEELTGLIVNQWRRFEALVAGSGLRGVLDNLERALEVDTSGASARPLIPTERERAALERVAAALPEHGAREVLKCSEAVLEGAWRGFLLTDKDTARKSLFKKAELALIDEVDTTVLAEAAVRAEAQVRARKLYRNFDVTRSALLWAAAVHGAYGQRKREQGLTDYGDLLDGLERVLGGTDNALAEWIWYGLDRRFRHLVVDEAQDNNPQQDRIVRWLAQSILSGDVGEGATRTVLAVGDMKQSIFRFQGAVPELFVQLREVMAEWAGGLREVDLTHSFRSGREVLALVDRVFAARDSGEVVVGNDFRTWPAHKAVAAERASRVELWEPVAKVEKPEIEPWALPTVRAAAGAHGEDILALRQIGAWLQERVGRVVMPSTGVPLRWEDVMLVVQRNSVAGLAAGVLRGMGIPVASAGGVVPLIVEDAVAMLRVIYNPADNLALAQVLKGIRGFDDAALLKLADRSGVAKRAPGDPEVVWSDFLEGADAAWLAGYVAMAWDAPLRIVQRVIADIVATGGGDETVFEGLLGWAEGCENLPELVERLELDDLPVVSGKDGLRVLTVHGSKGLQAPLVILPDTMQSLDSIQKDKLLWGDGVVMVNKDAGLTELGERLASAEKQRKKADSLRGLYVAMTRAMDWLVVAGFGNVTDKTDTWWTRVREGFRNEELGVRTDTVHILGDEFEIVEREVVLPTFAKASVGRPDGRPGWWGREVNVPLAGEVQSAAQVRGETVHALLQGLNVVADDDVRLEAERVREALPWLWAKGARSEMAVSLDSKVGRIDRMVERDSEWWVVDFKTGTVPELMPEVYASQVRGYVAALMVTWPERKFRAGIVWTASARLDEVAIG